MAEVIKPVVEVKPVVSNKVKAQDAALALVNGEIEADKEADIKAIANFMTKMGVTPIKDGVPSMAWSKGMYKSRAIQRVYFNTEYATL